MLSLLFAVLTGVHASTLTADEDLFQKGLAAYQSQHFAEARDDFQKLLDQSKTDANPNLLHDLALSAYQVDQKPLALALWRKALSLRPGFSLARKGRDLLEKTMQMRPYERDSLNLWFARSLEMVSIYELLWVTALFILGAGWLWIGYLGDRKAALEEERSLPAFPSLPLLLSCALIVILTLVFIKGREMLTARATILGPKVSARSLPAEESVNLFDLRGGEEVIVRRHQSGWTQIENSDQADGWIKDSDLLITSDTGG